MLALAPALEWLGIPAPLGIPAQHWIFPAQTLACGALLLAWWPRYGLRRPAGLALTLGVGVLVFALWVAPQALFGAARRLDGFDPAFFEQHRGLFAAVVAVRFVRLVLVVPLIEEIFWRGFLLRYVISERFRNVPFGAFSWASFAIVTIGFMLEHTRADYPAALAAGALYNLVAYRTKSLSSCVLAHAVTNALLGCYIMQTRQWGFW